MLLAFWCDSNLSNYILPCIFFYLYDINIFYQKSKSFEIKMNNIM